jgi:hypothetical protein
MDPGLARATFGDWVPTFALSAEGILLALGFGLTLWLAFHALWRLVTLAGQRWTGTKHPHPRAPRTEPTLDRRKAVAQILARRGDALVVAGLGAPCWDTFPSRARI